MMKPICVPCERFMRMKKSGYYFLEGMEDGTGPRLIERGKGAVGWKPYKVWSGDLYECPTCHTQVVSGVGMYPLAEHYQPGFAKTVARTGANQLLVKDC